MNEKQLEAIKLQDFHEEISGLEGKIYQYVFEQQNKDAQTFKQQELNAKNIALSAVTLVFKNNKNQYIAISDFVRNEQKEILAFISGGAGKTMEKYCKDATKTYNFSNKLANVCSPLSRTS